MEEKTGDKKDKKTGEKKISEKKRLKLMDKALMAELSVNSDEFKKLKKKLLKAESKPERGIETWFRLSSRNLYTRLQIADTKSNILITTNALIISIVLGSLYPKLADDPHLIFAIGGIILTNIVSITFAILATIPKPATGAKGRNLEDIDLMAFEEYYDVDVDEYRHTVGKILEDGSTLYPSIITDIHKLGVTLARKYKFIRLAYIVFLYGMVLSVIAFGMCHFVYSY